MAELDDDGFVRNLVALIFRGVTDDRLPSVVAQLQEQILNQPSSGSAGGDLSGSYPNPDVVKVKGHAVPSGGTTGQALRLASDGTFEWYTPSAGGMSNPMTTADDIIVGGTSGTPTRVAKPGANKVWGTNSSGVLGYKDDPSTGGGGYTQGARANNSSAVAIPNTTVTTVPLNSELYDTDTIHSTVSNTSRLTCQTGGKYLMIGNVEWSGTGASRRLLQILLNGTTTIARMDHSSNGAGSSTNVSTIYTLAAGDYVELQAYQESGASLNLQVSGYSPVFMMQRIG